MFICTPPSLFRKKAQWKRKGQFSLAIWITAETSVVFFFNEKWFSHYTKVKEHFILHICLILILSFVVLRVEWDDLFDEKEWIDKTRLTKKARVQTQPENRSMTEIIYDLFLLMSVMTDLFIQLWLIFLIAVSVLQLTYRLTTVIKAMLFVFSCGFNLLFF